MRWQSIRGDQLKSSIERNFNMSQIREIFKHPFFLLFLISAAASVYLLARQLYIGVPYYDVFVYLDNALIFAGIPVGNMSVIYLSPLMPLLTSLVFRAGFVSASVIFILDAVVFVFGVLGLYLLFRIRFDQIQSFAGSLIFMSFPLVFTWATSGAIDVPGVSFSIWTIYILILGIRKESKFLYLVFPLLVVAFLARYTSVVLIFPILLYLLINANLAGNLKKIGVGVLAGLILMAPFFVYINIKLGNLDSIINIFTSTLLGAGSAMNDLGYNPDKLYYLSNLLNYISVGPLQGIYGYIQSPHRAVPSILSYLIFIVVFTGLGISLYQVSKRKLQLFRVQQNKNILLLIVMVLLSILGILSFFTTSYFVTELIFVAVLYTGYLFFRDAKVKNLEIDLLFLSWFGAFFIFHSVLPLKEDRYFITMTPALAYFIVLGLSAFIEKFKFYMKQENLRSWRVYLLVGLVLFSYTVAVHIGHTPQKGYGFYMQSASDWLKEYDPHYQDKIIYSNYDPAFTWYLKKEVKFGVPSLYPNAQAFSNYLMKGKADYYIDAYSSKPYIPGYHIIFSIESVSIYQRD